MNAPASTAPRPVDHYENFPVASWLCPAPLRPAIGAIYWFARTADDIADEGEATAAERLADLAAYGADLRACAGGAPSQRWPQVFAPLADALRRHALPLAPLADLLSAFTQDVVRTEAGAGYADRAELLDYCRRSANPVGRLLLHLYGVTDPASLDRSDRICTALQLINFWQDLGVDLARGRRYLPDADLRAHGLDPQRPSTWAAHPGARPLMEAQVRWARELMNAGAPLVRSVPGRAGWELRLVVQGGLRVLDRIAQQDFDTFTRRPRVGARDLPVMLWRSLRM